MFYVLNCRKKVVKCRRESETVVQLKGLNPGGRLPLGILAGGKPALEECKLCDTHTLIGLMHICSSISFHLLGDGNSGGKELLYTLRNFGFSGMSDFLIFEKILYHQNRKTLRNRL